MRNRKCVIRNCENCGKEFNARLDGIKNGNSRFCSIKCGRANKFGSKCSGWKGGKQIDSRGYIWIYSPYHPYGNKKKYVLEHRLVMEKFLNRFLLPIEIVHHINELVNDNRIENLMIVSKSKHMSLHFKFYWTSKRRKAQSKIMKINRAKQLLRL
jgi:hypothetical protein